MYKNKKDVDRHVEKLLTKLSATEFKSRAYSVARLYFEVGDYGNCQKYVEQYLTQKDNNAAAYKLLGQALQKMGQKDKALEHFKTSLDIDQNQTGIILDICELLADDDVAIEPGCANYWFEKAEATFPRHPVTFRLRERLVTMSDPDPEVLVNLLMKELNVRPYDTTLHSRLIKHYLHTNQFKEAFEHSCNVEFSSNNFNNNYAWYEILDDLLKNNLENYNKWLYQLLLLTVKERICLLSLTETPIGSSKSLVESSQLLHAYDQALECVAKAGADPGFAEFHAGLLQHHRGQFSFHAATLLLKRAKKDLMNWSEATKTAAPLMLLAWQTVPLDSNVNWLRNAPEKQLNAVNRWYSEGTYRCSQSGHYLMNFQNKNQSLLEQISQYCSGTHWRDKLYETMFKCKTQMAKIKSSHFTSNAFSSPQLRLPRKTEVQTYDSDAQKKYGNSLHHFVWMLLNYKDYAKFECTIFDMLTPSVTSCGPETLNKLDIYAFLYCAALTCQQKTNEVFYINGERPNVLPANITDLLCPLSQMKWWDCAYKYSQNMLGNELTDIRATLSRGIEVVRCVDNHSMDPELLCILGRIFSNRAKAATSVDDQTFIEARAGLYYSSAIPLLEKLKSKMMIKVSERRMFDYTHKEIGTKELNLLLEESKLFVAVNHIKDGEYEKAIELLSALKTPQAYYHLALAYQKVGFGERNSSSDDAKSKYASMLSKAKSYAYKALDLLNNNDANRNLPLYSDTQELIEDIEVCLNKMDQDVSRCLTEFDGKYSSDENMSYRNEPKRSYANIIRNISSTPKANQNNTNYRTAIDSQILESSRVDQRHLERLDTEIKNLQKRDTTINDFMEQTRSWFEENRNLGNRIMSSINSNMENTTDQFRLLKVSVDQVKDQIDECRNECKDVGELKKQIEELKKEVNKIKISSSEPAINKNDPYNVDDQYRTNETTSNFGSQLPFPPQMLPTYNQRSPFPVPPNPYQLYNQTLYNLYNQYSQYGQPSAMPGAPPLFDPTRAPMSFPGVYPTPDQMFLDMAHLIPPAPVPAPAATVVPSVPVPHNLPTMPNVPAVPVPVASASLMTTSIFNTVTTTSSEVKKISQPLPVNVVITSSDPLPTSAPAPAPVLSVVIPQKHIKTTQPHNYQIALPTVSQTSASSPPVFSFSIPESKSNPVSSLSNWNKANDSPLYKAHGSDHSFEGNISAVDGPFAGATPNTSLNKSRTLSEKSNTSVENYDPCPDFKPIVPLPAEVAINTGEEKETAIFSSRAKLFRFVDKQWKERGLGVMKLLKHNNTGKVRVLMRREQVHKVCANHIITPEMEINPMKNETKAYIWVANDFAEETIVLEKFCIRFKTAETAKEFYETFEKARQESATLCTKGEKTTVSVPESIVNKSENKTSNCIDITLNKPAVSQGKTVIGGFTFSSTPMFKPLENDNKAEDKTTDSGSNKPNVFSTLAFKTSTSSPFSNLFNAPSAPSITTSNVEVNKGSDKNKLNSSDTVEEFEPTAEFKPVIALPALVEQKTGEEDEIVLFEHRAKLLRYDATTKEWKERGLGIMKLLSHQETHKVRLLMRREQIMKVCCNHIITKEMTFQKMPKMDKAVTWCAKDFSEGELIAETFCLRFKNVQLCDDFIAAIITAQTKMEDDTRDAKEEKNVPKQATQSGFGDKFKAKAGSWYCQGCYTNNLENYKKCACCDQAKPDSTTTTDASVEPTKTSSWGDKFKPRPGSWECKSCLVRNEANIENCKACNSANDPTSNKSSTSTVVPDNKYSFSFGIPKLTAASIQNQNKAEPSAKMTTPESGGFGDKFKPKAGTWECKQCYVRNAGASENCCSCNAPQDPNAPKKSTSLFDTTAAAQGVKFRFGIPPTQTNEEKPKSVFENTGATKFNFGIPSNTTSESEKPKPTAIIYDSPKMTSKTDAPINFSMKNTDVKVTSQTDLSKSFANKDSGFGFKFTSKSPAKSPHKQGDESEEEDLVTEEDCSAHFTPVVPLPDKVEVVTGEENDEELYAHRSRLYIFVSGEWKERGTGIVKILKNNKTNKLRVIMRREQVLKICLNHALTSDVIYNPKDEKTWIFAANDFSEGELALHKFCLRFSNKEIAMQFKDAVDNAIQGKPLNLEEESQLDNDKNSGDDVMFVSETQATAEDKQKAKELMLPENYYNYKSKEPCRGCRGCTDDDVQLDTNTQTAATAVSVQSVSQPSVITPMKAKLPSFQSPATSLYGTPGNNKTFDTSIFRTPLGSIGENTVASSPTNNANDSAGLDATNKENVFGQNTQLFSNFGGQKSIFGTPQTTPTTKFTFSDTQISLGGKSSLLAPPKLSTFKLSGDNQSEAKSLFASTQATAPASTPATGVTFFSSAAGISSNKSVFSFATDKQKEKPNSEVKSIFGEAQPTINLFSGGSAGSIFGPGSLNSDQPKSDTLQNSGFSSIFSNDFDKQSSIWGANAGTDPTPAGAFAIETNTENKPEAKEIPLKLDEKLSFATLSTTGPGFQKKADFSWEGTGQQLFTSSQNKDCKNESGPADQSGGNAEDEFDPHYEPIVPLPDKIVVTTGEEDEEKLFCERAKLYRYDDKAKEWKERGVGDVKILYHPKNNTYRLLLRREQVHKAVLNMLIHLDMNLTPMKNSECAWNWPGINYAESPEGQNEMLALRFKNSKLAVSFRESVDQCVRKLQASAAAAIRKENEIKEAPAPSGATGAPALLRLPKHLQDTARADPMLAAAVSSPGTRTKPNGDSEVNAPPEPQVDRESNEEPEEDDDEYCKHEYHQSDYYHTNEEEEAYYTCEGEAVVKKGDEETTCPHANIFVLFDQEIYTPKILVANTDTGEILADMLIHTDTEFKMDGDSCKWTGTDYTSNEPVDKTVTINFYDSDSAMEFYDSCETSKAATYSSNDPESK